MIAPWYSKWLSDDGGDGPDVDNFLEDVGEQEAPHTILHNIDNGAVIRLKSRGRNIRGWRFPRAQTGIIPSRTSRRTWSGGCRG